jgi:lipoate-protein ligase A
MITTWGAPPELNMGLDGALLESAEAPPTLRFYTWSPPALSLGYFQRFADIPAAERAPVVVRRITGGGAIHHANELTFSIAADADHALFCGRVAQSYERVHALICAALATLGCEAALRGDDPLLSDTPETGMCFHHSTPLDLAWGGRKGVGSAQRRRSGRILHHGSIKLSPSEHDTGVAELSGISDPSEVSRAIIEAFRTRAEIRLEASVPTRDERVLAEELGEIALDPAFVRRR